LKENEENRGLNDKKAFEDQFIAFFDVFCYFSVGGLSFSHTVVHLEYSWSILGTLWHTLDSEKEGKEKQESTREQVDQQLQLGCFESNRLHV